MFKLTGSLLTVFLMILTNVRCSKILGVVPIPSYSHYVFVMRIMEELAGRGHDVTLVTPYLEKEPIENLKIISIAEAARAIDGMKNSLLDLNGRSVFYNMAFVLKLSSETTANVLKQPNFQKLLDSKEKIDAVVLQYFQNEALMALGHHFKAPLILASPLPSSAWNSHLVANPHSSAYIPYTQSSFFSEMSFFERVLNTLYDNVYFIMREFYSIKEQEKLLKKHFPTAPNLEDLRYNASIFLVNSHESFDDPLPRVRNMIPVGGCHVSAPKELPEKLKVFLDSSPEGVILFSMGSNLKSTSLPLDVREGILKAFSRMKQKVLWKFEENLPNLPPNVNIEKWLPQQDVLAHPNIVAFITHGGLMSAIEAVHFGVPLIGIPVFGDQKVNVARAVRDGYAVSVALGNLNEETLSNALNEIINNPKYREEVKRRSTILHDQKISAVETAANWIEYAIRHKGAPHLRTPALKLKWYQRNLLDVYSFLIAVLVILFYLIGRFARTCFSIRYRKAEFTINKKNE